MTAIKHIRYWLPVAIAALLLSVAGCKSSSSNGDNGPPGEIRPAITSLSRSAANIGDQVLISGLNFGDTQSGGTARLNGLDFTINSWTDTVIDATVAAGMTSGIVVVTRDGLESQSGPEAQLFIPSAPPGTPIISALNPDFGHRGEDTIQISGINFGNSPSTDKVYFTQQTAVSQAEGLVQAQVVTIDVGGTPVPQWTNSSIEVWVPATAASGNVFVEVGGVMSNGMHFEALPPQTIADPPSITGVTPGNGPVGTAITITGANFGHIQGGSVAELVSQADSTSVMLNIQLWTNTEINAVIPPGAQTGNIKITTSAGFAQSDLFVVANAPQITGVSPSQIQIGKAFTVYGNYFGYTKGAGTLKVGSTTVATDTWNDGLITVSALPSLNYSDPQAIPVTVTSDNGLISNIVIVSKLSTISGLVTVNPSAGQRDDVNNTGGTPFNFDVTVFGGVGPFEFTLVPDVSNSSVTGTPTTSLPVSYVYPYDAAAPDQEEIETQMLIRDNGTGDEAVVSGPTLLIVRYGIPVVTAVELGKYNRTKMAPNDWCYDTLDDSYFDFTFLGNETYFTSNKTDIMDQGNPVQAYIRNEESFLNPNSTARPYGHRYRGSTGSEQVVRGLNFGATTGQLFMNSTNGANRTEITAIKSWTDNEIRFDIPADVPKDLSGKLEVVPSGVGKIATSIQNLIVSPWVNNILPADGVTPDINGNLTLTGFDFSVPQVPNVTGPNAYLVWWVRAKYTDPFTGTPNTTGLVPLVHPVPVTVAGQTITFNMGDIGTVVPLDVEVRNAAGTAGQVVAADSLVTGPTTYFCFLWTGALSNEQGALIANSGVFSEGYTITIKGSLSNQTPNAVLTANPTSGAASLTVNFDASGSSDPDGSITNYKWDFDGNGDYTNLAEEVAQEGSATATYTYAANGTYNARVQVVDDGSPGLTDIASQTINVGGGGGNLTVSGSVWELFANWDGGLGGVPAPEQPEAGVIVIARDASDVLIGTSAPTDANGRWSITGLDPYPGGMKVLVDPAQGLDIAFPINADHSFFILLDADKDLDLPAPGTHFLDKNGFLIDGM